MKHHHLLSQMLDVFSVCGQTLSWGNEDFVKDWVKVFINKTTPYDLLCEVGSVENGLSAPAAPASPTDAAWF